MQLAQSGGVRVDRENHLVGCDGALRGADDRGRAPIELDHRRVLVDADAQLQRDAGETAHEVARMHRGRRRVEHALEVHGRAGTARDLVVRELLEGLDPERLAELHDGQP